MKRLMDFINMLEIKTVSNENYFSISDFIKLINENNEREIEAEDYILTPYYVHDGKRMELYEYELTISADSTISFDKYLFDLTGKSNLNDIPYDVIQRQKICFIKCSKDTHSIQLSLLKDYINTLINDERVKSQIISSFKEFDTDNFYFEVY